MTQSVDQEGAVFDLGYRPHAGPLLGRRGAFLATLRDGLRRTFGIRRKARKKVIPWLLLGVAALPAIAVVVISLFGELLVADPSVDNPFGDPLTLLAETSTAFLLFIAFATPELLIPDRVQGVLSVYASRPIRATDYLLARCGALAVAACGFLIVPQLVMYLAVAAQHRGGILSGLTAEFWSLPKVALATVFYLLTYGAPAFALSLFVSKIGVARGIYLATMLFLQMGQFADRYASRLAQRIAISLDFPEHPHIVARSILGSGPYREYGDAVTGLWNPVWSAAIILAVTLITALIALRRYRKYL